MRAVIRVSAGATPGAPVGALMSRVGFSILAGLLALASGASTHVRAAAVQSATPQSSSLSPAQATDEFVQRYCISCHNERLRTGGLTLEGLDTHHPAGNSEI